MGINKITLLICTLILSIGVLGGGYSIGWGMYMVKKASRVVTVKGLAEQDVKSDLGLWEINYREIGNDLIVLDQKLQKDHQAVTDFLKQHGFTDQEINHTQLKIEDRFANVYNQTNSQTSNDIRYVVTGGTRVRSQNVELIEKTLQDLDKLLQQGIALAFDASTLSPNPSFYYTKLDEMRPTMMAAATRSAYSVANQFAKDSNSTLGGIQRASQGVFQVMSRDTSTMSSDWNSDQNAMGSINKKVRLVTTIDYRLQ